MLKCNEPEAIPRRVSAVEEALNVLGAEITECKTLSVNLVSKLIKESSMKELGRGVDPAFDDTLKGILRNMKSTMQEITASLRMSIECLDENLGNIKLD